MEIVFYASLLLVMLVTINFAPLIVRGKMSFFWFAGILLAFYGSLFLFNFQNAQLRALFCCFCICGVGCILFIKKKREHNPKDLTDIFNIPYYDVIRIQSCRRSKISCYRRWCAKLVIVNIVSVILVWIISCIKN